METPEIGAIIVLDTEGERITARYFDRSYVKDLLAQTEFEKKLHKKTKGVAAKVDAEVLLLDGMNVLYRSGADVTFYVVGKSEENELILVAVLDALTTAVTSLLKGVLDKRSILTQLELLLLAIDELVDGGIPLELDPSVIESRVLLRGAVPESISSYQEATINTMMDKAKDKLAKQFIK